MLVCDIQLRLIIVHEFRGEWPDGQLIAWFMVAPKHSGWFNSFTEFN